MFNANDHMMDLKGKQYLQVMWRLVWFREEKPNWGIDTETKEVTPDYAIFTAKIYDDNGILKASGHGSETPKDFKDYIEKAETKAIGRALAILGYGTQFAPDLDEGERIVDSPVKRNFTKDMKPADTEPPKEIPVIEVQKPRVTEKQADILRSMALEKWVDKAEPLFIRYTGCAKPALVPAEMFDEVKKKIQEAPFV